MRGLSPGGVRGSTAGGLVSGVSGTIGAQEADLFVSDTVDASLEPESPTAFDLGSHRQQEVGVNFEVCYATDMVNVAGGAEWRDEQYQTTEGRATSWAVGPCGRGQGSSASSNGFFACGRLAAGAWSRSNVAVYGDRERPGGVWTFGFPVRVRAG